MNEKILERFAEMMIEKIRQVSASGWEKPWFTPQMGGVPQNLSGRQYSNMNRLMLYMEMDRKGYTLPVFMTFNQLKEENLMIDKGTHAMPVLYYEMSVKDKETGGRISYDDYKGLSPSEKDKYKLIPFTKSFNVFNIDQTDFKAKYPERYEALKNKILPSLAAPDKGSGNPALESLIKNQQWVCPIETQVQDRAYYSPSEDHIVLPAPEQFKDMGEFQMTALHEMAHSTGHPSRLNRDLANFFMTEKYAKEEIVAEFTSAVVGRDLGIAVTPRTENAQYLKSWLSNLEEDPKYIMGVLREVGKASSMIEESVQNQHVVEDKSVKEETAPSVPVKEEESKGFVSSDLLDTHKMSKEKYPDAIVLIRVGDEYKVCNEDAVKCHEVLGIDIKSGISEKDGTVVKVASFRFSELDTHLPKLIRAGNKIAISDEVVSTKPLDFSVKGGHRELTVKDGTATIRTNGKDYDATGIMTGLKKAKVNVSNISEDQWKSMLRGQGVALNPSKPKTLFSIQKQVTGYGIRVANISKNLSSSLQKE